MWDDGKVKRGNLRGELNQFSIFPLPIMHLMSLLALISIPNCMHITCTMQTNCSILEVVNRYVAYRMQDFYGCNLGK
jgi:hypothetical protein